MDNFPNRSTQIACNYIQTQELNDSTEAIKSHLKMLCVEANKTHPFLASCVKEVCNNLDWEFIQVYLHEKTIEKNLGDKKSRI